MPAARLPANETKRLSALHHYRILDTEPEDAFDDFASLAAHICGTPIALISLIDRDRQWFKSRVGLEVQETHRDLAFCAHAILDDATLVVQDAQNDLRFFDNALVTGDPKIRFYAGALLMSATGMPLGTICAIDTKPRTLDEKGEKALETLARRVMVEMELRTARRRPPGKLGDEPSPETHAMCSLCCRFRERDGSWVPPVDFLEKRFGIKSTHRICKDCLANRLGL
ncbi:MAG: GAF domain-containing protein [Verrucomicrobiales bacterium]|nr:GAF domain-containing protein [Verrucomicrobiales bacterium]